MRTLPLTALCGALLLTHVGCSGSTKDPNALPTYRTKVTVTYKGAPVEGATVTFANEKAPAFGRTDASGVAVMKTYEEGDGAVAGSHRVSIVKTESTGAPVADVDSPDYDPNAPPPVITYLVPEKYANITTSGLTAEIKESGPNEIKFELTD